MTTSEPTTERDGEFGVKFNEPTTKEIVETLRRGCLIVQRQAADRLESQEQTIEALTARAESAEQERDDIEKSLARRIMKHLGDNEFDSTFVCEICEYNLMNSPKCLSCGSDHHYGENFELKHTLRGLPQIASMTARTEQAEKERDTLISSIERLRTKKIELCSICEFEDLIACCHKNHCEGYQFFKRRGLPQDGEGKENG